MSVHESSPPAYRQQQGNKLSNPHVLFSSCLWCWESWISLDQVTHRMRYWRTDSYPLIPCFHFTVRDPYLCQARAGVLPLAHTEQRSLWLWQGLISFSHPSILTQMYLHRPVDFAHSTSCNLKLSKNHTKKRTFLSVVLLWQVSQTLPTVFVVETLAAGFLSFSFLSLFLLVTLPSCVLIWWALGKWNKK